MAHDWVNQIINDAAVGTLLAALKKGRRIAADGSWGSSGHLLAGALHRGAGGKKSERKPVLLVVAHLDDADEAAEDLSLFEGLEAVAFPALEVMPGETNVSLELLADRIGLVSRLLAGDQPAVVVAPVQAIMQAVPEEKALGSMSLEIKPGMTLVQEGLSNWLVEAGYSRVDVVEEPGDFALRGGLVDVYPPGNLPAVRVDFFGDEVDELSEIDLQSMASNRKIKSVRLIGATLDQVQGEERTTSLWSMMRDDTVVVLNERMEIDEQARGYYERLTDATGIYSPPAVQQAFNAMAVVEVNQFAAPGMADSHVAMPVRSLLNFDTDAAKAVGELGELALGAGDEIAHRVVVVCQRDAEKQRLLELVSEHTPAAKKLIEIETGYLYRGFVWGTGERVKEPPLMVVPHQELFHRYHARRRIRRVGGGKAVETFLDMQVGDYVVHANHGIAHFKGIRMMKRDGAVDGEEYLTLEFADKVLLHVPASQIELIHKYVGGFSGRPPLSKMGGTRWKKQTEDAKEAAKDMAAELLRVQAARASMPGHRFGEDTPWMSQFEAEFPYEETDDQLAAIRELKKSMCNEQPMDRLICGDVGYGKTEVAMRAAFKAVEGGKQVAVLCPTTVLCEQHERSFKQRMADYPVSVASLNRFKTGSQIKQTIEDLQAGKVDIVIGTHRVLSQDVDFKDLGLVVVDEEQRFGVEHKNKLMRFRVTVDVLTLSATPIPRTLHMALLGLRDISSLSTPPADRRAVVTEVIPNDRGRVRAAIMREMNRGGQCFYVHNRVHNIKSVAAEIQGLAPEARVEIGHGQMSGRALEQVMLRFVRGEIDVLVCTTIIESGIDVPTANTMFIADADQFGLAGLHQLRGRVGRYKHRAYCYLLLPESRPLSEISAKRLRAIEEYNMLGAGFKIAMRDMEIRGVGNLLGQEQSGHIAMVGYEMYCVLLEQATNELTRSEVARPVQTHMELGMAGHIPPRFIPSQKHRLEVYRRINRVVDSEDARKLESELNEAYGRLPKAAEVMLELATIRGALSRLRVEALKLDGPDLVFSTRHIQALSPLLAKAPGSVRLVDAPKADAAGSIYWRPPEGYTEAGTLLAVLRKLVVRPMEGKGVVEA